MHSNLSLKLYVIKYFKNIDNLNNLSEKVKFFTLFYKQLIHFQNLPLIVQFTGYFLNTVIR